MRDRTLRSFAVAAFLSAGLATLSGCNTENPDGTKNTLGKVEDKAEVVGEKIKDGAVKAGEEIKKDTKIVVDKLKEEGKVVADEIKKETKAVGDKIKDVTGSKKD